MLTNMQYFTKELILICDQYIMEKAMYQMLLIFNDSDQAHFNKLLIYLRAICYFSRLLKLPVFNWVGWCILLSLTVFKALFFLNFQNSLKFRLPTWRKIKKIKLKSVFLEHLSLVTLSRYREIIGKAYRDQVVVTFNKQKCVKKIMGLRDSSSSICLT